MLMLSSYTHTPPRILRPPHNIDASRHEAYPQPREVMVRAASALILAVSVGITIAFAASIFLP